jgi:hypothetical protein
MPYQNNFDSNQWPEFQQWPNADSNNGRTGSQTPGAVRNQTTQAAPQSTTDPYQSFKQTAMSWGTPQATDQTQNTDVMPQFGPLGITPAGAPTTTSTSPYNAAQLSQVIAPNAINESGNPGGGGTSGGTTGGGGTTTTPPPTTTTTSRYQLPSPGGNISTGGGTTTTTPTTPVDTPTNITGIPPTGVNTLVTPPGTATTPLPGPNTQITPQAPNFPDLPSLIKTLQGMNEPLFRQEQTDLSRNLNAQAAQSGAINSGGFADSYSRAMSNLVNQQNSGLSTEAFQANQQNIAGALQKYGVDINDRQFWANLALKAYQGDQQAQQFYTYITTQLGLTPAQIANIIGGFTPGVAFNPNP